MTERQRAAQIKASLAAIVESSDDAIIGKTREGIVTSWNRGAQQLYGYSPEEVIGKSISIIVPDQREGELADIMQRINAGYRINHFETVRQHKDGRLIDVSLTASPIRDARGQVVGASAIARDIRAQKSAETMMQQSANRMRLITDSVPVLIGYVGSDERYRFVNQMYEAWFGQSRKELCGRKVREVIGDEAYGTNALRISAALSGKRQTFEMKLPRHDGVPRDVQVQYVPHTGPKNRVEGFFVVVTDVTRLKRAEVEAAMLTTSDNERQRIGRELHDTVIQALAGAAMMAESLRQKLDAQSPHAETAGRLVKVLQDAQRDARRLSRGLIPVEVDVAGLMIALHELAEQTSMMHQIDCKFLCQTDVLVENNSIATHLFRIAQEATHNAVKHAKPNRIVISLKGQRVLRLSIKDDGKGLTVDKENSSGSGLRIMRYRADAIGGKLRIESGSGPGTIVVCTLRRKV